MAISLIGLLVRGGGVLCDQVRVGISDIYVSTLIDYLLPFAHQFFSTHISGTMFEPHDKEKALHATPEELPEVEVGEVKDVKNADAALDFLRHEGEGIEMTAEDEKRLVRKIDWMIMPLMWCCYVAQYLDKTLINYAAVMGLYDDANITKADFSNLVSRVGQKLLSCTDWYRLGSSMLHISHLSSLMAMVCSASLLPNIWESWCCFGVLLSLSLPLATLTLA